MSDGSHKETQGRKTRRQRKNPTDGLSCKKPTYPALTYSSKWIGKDFYTWVNKEWISDTTIPLFENDFGASEEIEECINREMTSIFRTVAEKSNKTKEDQALHTLQRSFDSDSLPFIKEILDTIYCVQSPRDVMKHFGLLSKYRLPSLINVEYIHAQDKRLELLLVPNIPAMAEKLYDSPEFIHKYKDYLDSIGKALKLDRLGRIVPFEKKLITIFESFTDDKISSMKGYGFTRKYKLPWDAFFDAIGLRDWRTMQTSYKYPAMLRKLGTLLHQVPISMWKSYLYKCYLFPIVKYLGDPFATFNYTFIGKYLQGQETPTPKHLLFLDFAYQTLQDTLSRRFWETCGDPEILSGVEKLAKSIQRAAIRRMRENTWLSTSSKIASIEKINAITYKLGRPAKWEAPLDVDLDPTSLVKNRLTLGEASFNKVFERLGTKHTYWEEGIYRVNAYYYSEFNEIVFPYGILTPPFYRKRGNPSWNYGGIGATLGHELCHAFDDDGKEYDQHGKVRQWWTKKDRRRYAAKARALDKLYTSETIQGKHLDGENTLSENIADLAGVSICLEALRENLRERGVKDFIPEYRIFFISYATSWRTLYRSKKLKRTIMTDVHSPAYVRVNKVVSQLDEWYEAFDIDDTSPLYVKPEDRVVFF